MIKTITEALKALKTRQISAVELNQTYIKRFESSRHLNTTITAVDSDAVLAQAKIADQNYAAGTQRLLEGIPVMHKDLFCTKGIRTTAGSKMLSNFVPPYESTVTQNMTNAGAITLAKTNMDEFAMGSANINSFFGASINPWKTKDGKDLTPGGSSGGSAAAVAAGLCLGATGSDTGGSIRQPAAFCGITGIKPTYGLCSRFGMMAFASSLDQAGVFGKTVEDTAILLQSIAGFDEKDATSQNIPIPPYAQNLNSDVKGLRVGVVKEYVDQLSGPMAELFEKGVNWLKQAGATIQNVSLQTTSYALPVYYVLAPAEASSNLARYDGVRYGFRAENTQTIEDVYVMSRTQGFGKEVKRRILIGTYVLSSGHYEAYYHRAQKVRQAIREDFNEAFQHVDVILTPTTPTPAFALNEAPSDPVEMYLNDIYTVTVNLAGLPAISIPAGLSPSGLPLGLQLIAPSFEEQRLFNVGTVLEQAAQFPFLEPNA